MSTLIAVYNSDGCVGRCDAKCYNATDAKCDCICGGRNHGAGKQQAMDNTRQMAESMIAEWNQAHPGEELRYRVSAAQQPLPGFVEAT